jgi:hypothetical protein
MPSIDIQLRRGELRAAAALPQLIDGAALGPPEYRLKQRPNGVWAIFEGAKYVKTTGLRDRLMAGEFLEIFRLQQEARSEGIIDARYVQADVIAGYYLEQIPTAAAGVRRNDTHRLRRLRPEFDGKLLFDLTGAAVAAIEKRVLERYKPSTVQVSFQALRTAIRVYCRDHATPLIMPSGAPTRPPGCDRVLTAEERNRVLRWARGSESYDPEVRDLVAGADRPPRAAPPADGRPAAGARPGHRHPRRPVRGAGLGGEPEDRQYRRRKRPAARWRRRASRRRRGCSPRSAAGRRPTAASSTCSAPARAGRRGPSSGSRSPRRCKSSASTA